MSPASSSQPLPKKAKIDPDDAVDSPPLSLEDATEKAWEHYRNYIESTQAQADNEENGDCGGEGEGEGDVDELEEMIHEVLLKHPFSPELKPLESLANAIKTNTNGSISIASPTDLVPILISVGYYHLADVAISECLEYQQVKESDEQIEIKQMKSELIRKCQHLIEESLRWYPENASMWSMGANFGRMLQVISPATVCQWYERAVECAVQVRSTALQLLDDEQGNCPDIVKEWLELLLLNQVAGVEYGVDDEEDEEEDGEDDEEDLEKETGDDEGYFSSSSVEATARFMAAMLHSTAGKHDCARKHLEHFPVTHRVHPKVWQPNENGKTSVDATNGDNGNVPFKYQRQTDEQQGILPPKIYQRLCQVFAPNAAYWCESNYNHRGYYSYYMDMPDRQSEKDFVVSNLIEDVIWNHLYPLVNKQVQSQKNKKNGSPSNEVSICGAEWWVHTRPIQANLGHNLHFDTDEALLAQESAITHPIYSSVLYLTGGSSNHEGGATIVFDQTPDAEEVATKAWRCVPEDNTYLTFPGNMLHGVLPCPGKRQDSDAKAVAATTCSIRDQWNSPQNVELESHNRLTFMVGFWTRRVPDKMKNRRLYGPCGPLPPRPSNGNGGGNISDEAGGEHSWVGEIFEGYDSQDGASKNTVPATTGICTTTLPVISPAWETLENKSIGETKSSERNHDHLEIPRAIDHRFFVNGAPKCFRDSLFERSGDDGDDEC